MANSRVTIKDVAREASVTPQTVSRAFRECKDISDQTRQRILQIADRMGYVRNNFATSLRSGASHQIAVVYDNLMNSYFSIMTELIQNSLKERGYTMLAISVKDTHLTETAYQTALGHNVDGIISFLEPNANISSLIDKYNVPVLLFGRRTDKSNIAYIHTDDITIGLLASKKLLESGCKNPLFITESLELTCAYDRYQGFREPFLEQGIEPILYANELGKELRAEKCLLKLYEENNFPDGIFCFNDMLAFEVLYVIEKYSLPQCKVIGVDDIQSEIFFPRRLTSVGVDKKLMTHRCVEMMIEIIQSGKRAVKTITQPVFLVQGSTA